MRVAMITDHSTTDNRVDGGVEAVTKYLVDALKQLGTVDLHTVSFSYEDRSERQVKADGYTQHVLPGSRLGTITAFRRDQYSFNSWLRKLRPDIVHAQGAGHSGILAARSSYPSVITVHGIIAEEARFFVKLSRRLQYRALALLSDYYCIKNAKHTILISPYVENYFSGRLGGKHYLIPNAISDEFFSIPRSEEPGCILFAGRVLPLKGVGDLIKAVSIVSNMHRIELVLAGSLREKEYVDKLARQVSELGLEDVVHLRGVLDEVSLRRELGRCAVLVLPSYQETAPMVVAEAMAAGAPVIATNVGGIPYQVRDGVTGFLIDPGNVEGLADRLSMLLSDENLRRSLGEAAKVTASEEYSAENVAQRTIEVYRRVIDEASKFGADRL